MKALAIEGIRLRRQRLFQNLFSASQSIEKKVHSLHEQIRQSEEEPDWSFYGSLLQTHFHSKPTPKNGHYELLDYSSGETVRVPADVKLGLKAQLERFFHLSKRNKKRLEESKDRILSLMEKLSARTMTLEKLDAAIDLSSLLILEQEAGLSAPGANRTPTKDQKRISDFSGKQYRSREGLIILVGRNLTENLELTFKIARGNDLWLHVKGRPGSHTVILLPPKRTASLETLLDAAQLCLLHSGGKDWGKTDVDYTWRKHVKKIKNQTEVSYSQNKTLSVSVEEDRIKRLYETEES
jgi:predicted ribosome quality control (RQC) complex YloA/Tae2 family protein